MSNLDDFIPDVEAIAGNPDYDNIPLKNIAGVVRQREPLNECYGCPLFASNQHKCFKRIRISEGQAELISAAVTGRNELSEYERKLQAQISMMNYAAHGVNNDYDKNNFASPSLNMSVVAVYKLVGAGSTLTVQLTESSPSPLSFYNASQYPPYGMSMPPMGVATFSANSLLTHHGGFRFYKLGLDLTQSYTTGDTFTVYVDGNASAAMTKFPSDDEDDIYVFLRFYDVPEMYLEPEEVIPFSSGVPVPVCRHSKRDYTGSYGNYFCECGKAASKLSTFVDKCNQTDCDHYELKTSYQSSTDVMGQIIHSIPWSITYDGISAFYAERFGCPSLASLCQNIRAWECPNGQHGWHFLDLDTGGWVQLKMNATVDEALGLNTLKNDGALIGVPSTYNSYFDGPAANVSKKSDYANQALTDTNDSHRVMRQCITRSQDDVNCFWGSWVDWFGYYQQFRQATFYAPRLSGSKTGLNYTYTVANYDAYFNETNIPASGVYKWKLQITDHLTGEKVRGDTDQGLPSIGTFNIDAADYDDGTLVADLRNREITCSSTYGTGYEMESSWFTGGLNVPLNENLRIKNWANIYSLLGPNRWMVQNGDVATINGRKYWIERTSPMTGSVSSWIPYNALATASITGQGCYIFVPYNQGTETLQSIHVYTDAVTLGDFLIELTPMTGTKPYPNQNDTYGAIPLNYYWYTEETRLVGDVMKKGLSIYFSQRNAITSAIGRRMYYQFATNVSQYDNFYFYIWVDGEPIEFTDGFDLVDDAELQIGMSNLYPFIMTGAGIAIDSVTCTIGETEYQFTEANEVTPWSDWHVFNYSVDYSQGDIRLKLHSQWANNTLTIKYKIVAIEDQENVYYNNFIAWQGQKPADYYNYGNKRDQIYIHDANGTLQNYQATGEEISIGRKGIALEENATVKYVVYGSETERTLSESDYAWFGADGCLYGKTRLPSDSCLMITASFADRNCFRLAEELNNIRDTLGRIQN